MTPQFIANCMIRYMIPFLKKNKLTVEELRERIPPKNFVRFCELIYRGKL